MVCAPNRRWRGLPNKWDWLRISVRFQQPLTRGGILAANPVWPYVSFEPCWMRSLGKLQNFHAILRFSCLCRICWICVQKRSEELFGWRRCIACKEGNVMTSRWTMAAVVAVTGLLASSGLAAHHTDPEGPDPSYYVHSAERTSRTSLGTSILSVRARWLSAALTSSPNWPNVR